MTETEAKTETTVVKLDPDEIYQYMQIAQGKNPKAQQTITDFINMKNDYERTNWPSIETVLCITQLRGYGQCLYGGEPNPFDEIAGFLAQGYMARHGEKANQFVDIVRGVPDLADLQTAMQEPQKQGLMSRIFGSKKGE